MTKVKTMKVSGGDYAKVAERLKLFRSENPRGLIETNHEFTPNGDIIFRATIIKDLSKDDSAKATGTALGKKTGTKAFEKTETIAVGSALAMLGYAADGEIASSEEMEEFFEYKEQKKEEALLKLSEAENLEQLKQYFLALGTLMSDPEIIAKKDELKATLK